MIAAIVVLTVLSVLLLAGEWLAPRCRRVDRALHRALGGGAASWVPPAGGDR